MSTPEEDANRQYSLLNTIRHLEEQRLDKRWQLRLFIKVARSEGATWRQIGDALGTSPQSAWQTYHLEKGGEIKPLSLPIRVYPKD